MRWEAFVLAAAMLSGCSEGSARAASLVQQVNMVLSHQTPIAYVAIPGKVIQTGLSLLHVSVVTVENPASFPVNVHVSLCQRREEIRSCGKVIGSFSLFPATQPGTFVLRIPPELVQDTMRIHKQDVQDLARELAFDLQLQGTKSQSVIIGIERLVWDR